MSNRTKTRRSKLSASDESAGSDKRNAAFFSDRQKVVATNLEKTMRLRALRLAKEEQDRAAAALAPPVSSRARKKKVAQG